MDVSFSFFLIFAGSAILASLALFSRQPIIIAYLAIGAIIGPHGTQLVNNVELITAIGHIGIIFLLFLLGLEMQAKDLFAVAKEASVVVIASSILFCLIAFVIAKLFLFTTTASLIIGLSCMFSSTIIAIKLLPTTVLHHKHSGELMVGLLLLQDVLAICVLIYLQQHNTGLDWLQIAQLISSLLILIATAFFGVRYVLLPLIRRFDRFHEYIFLIAIAWCMSIAELGHFLGASEEIGAFLAGISIASSPISLYIAEQLKPLRNFFLILFFFSIGASFDFAYLQQALWPILSLALFLVVIKPIIYQFLLRRFSEENTLAWDVGLRLGQGSEFSLLIAYLAYQMQIIDNQVSHIIQAAVLMSFIISSYIVTLRLPSPIAVSEGLRRD